MTGEPKTAVDAESARVVARWSAGRSLYVAAGFCSLVGLLMMVALVTRPNIEPKVLGILALIVSVLGTVKAVSMARRSHCILTSSALLIPAKKGRLNTIPLTQVTAIAVMRATPGWGIFVWTREADPIRLPAPERVFRLKQQSNAAPTPEYWRRVAQSPCGAAATTIYQQARAAQQGSGYSMSHQPVSLLLQQRTLPQAQAEVRYWSPTGECQPSLSP